MVPLRLPTGPLRIVCLGAHPDDVEIGCGGALLTLAESRELTTTTVVATGTQDRAEEAVAAAKQFLPEADASVRALGLRDGYLPAQWGAVKEALEDMASSRPADLVFAPRVDDAHQDHRVVAEIATTVWRDSLVLHYEIPKWDGDFGRVTSYVRISPENAQRKVALLHECFPSQAGRNWWDDETFLGLMRLRGLECRHRYAEGFVISKSELAV